MPSLYGSWLSDPLGVPITTTRWVTLAWIARNGMLGPAAA